MSSTEWFTVQLVSTVVAGAFGLVAAILLFVEATADVDTTNQIRHRIQGVLQTITSSPLSDLPAYVLRLWTLLKLGRAKVVAWGTDSLIGTTVVGTIAAVSAVAAVLYEYGPNPVLAFVVTHLVTSLLSRPSFPFYVRKTASYVSDLAAFFLAATALTIFTRYALSLTEEQKLFSLAIALAIAPGALVLADILATFGELKDDSSPALLRRYKEALYLAGVAIGLSMVATISAAVLGNIASPWAPHVALSYQAIASNIACDALTLLLVIKLFAHRSRSGRPLNIVAAVVWSLLLSAILACSSLHLAFVGTSNEVSPSQTLNILVGLSPAGDRIELSVYFFLMHTTFIPVAVFLLVLLLAASVKLLIRTTAWVLGLSSRQQVSPFKAFAAVLAIFVALLSAASTIAGLMKEEVKDRERPNPSFERTPSGAATSTLGTAKHCAASKR